MNFRIFGLILACFCVLSTAYYPAEYDLRFEPDYRNCSFQVSEEVYFYLFLLLKKLWKGLCSANWGVILSEVLSNMYCLKQQKTNFLLSKQQLIDCTPNDPDTTLEKCQYFGATDTFFKALE